jgi:ferredoxin
MQETTKTAPTHWAQIWIAGDAQEAERICRCYCLAAGLCVTVAPTTFVYSGGAEGGVLVRLVNYPRFPAHASMIDATAHRLALALRDGLHQWSVMIETPSATTWLSRREERENG